MLCLVFAVAGPVMPGAGDVSPMDPTIAYGAAPTMLVFAPDGGAGFDLMGQDSFDQILTSWNTTIAGPLGTSGAHTGNWDVRLMYLWGEQSQGTPQLASTVVYFMFWHPRWSRTLSQ